MTSQQLDLLDDEPAGVEVNAEGVERLRREIEACKRCGHHGGWRGHGRGPDKADVLVVTATMEPRELVGTGTGAGGSAVASCGAAAP